MASSLSNLVNNASEKSIKLNLKQTHDDRKCETFRIKYKYCQYFFEYANSKDDLIHYSLTKTY